MPLRLPDVHGVFDVAGIDACERNKEPILSVLRTCFADRVNARDRQRTGSTRGCIRAAICRIWSGIPGAAQLSADLAARVRLEGSGNLRPPTVLDVRQAIWPARSVDAVFTANTLHIMSWAAWGLYRGVAEVLVPGGILCVYGPLIRGRLHLRQQSRFDGMAEGAGSAQRYSRHRGVCALAGPYGLSLAADSRSAAKQRLLVFHKEPSWPH